MEVGYDYSIVAIPDEDDFSNVSFDVYYFTSKSDKLNVIRVRNIYLSFLVHRIPGWTVQQTMRFIESRCHRIQNDDFVCEFRDDLVDASYNILGTKPCEYVEVFSRSPSRLKELEDMLTKDFEAYMETKDFRTLDEFDRIIVKNIETPFRYTANSTSMKKSIYWFSQAFNIPFIGFIEADIEQMLEYKGEYLKHDERKVNKTYILNANDESCYHNENVNKIMQRWTPPSGYKALETNKPIIASYDIETFNKGENPSEKSLRQYIFCIGVGFFHLMETHPFIRYSLISADIGTDEEIKDRLKPFDLKIETDIEFKAYLVEQEYEPYKDCKYIYDPGTIYLCVKNERELINLYTDLLLHHSPHIINGFNNFTFDDVWLYSRASRKSFGADLLNRYLQVFSTYDVGELEARKCNTLMPRYTSFNLKMEGKEMGKGTFTVRAPVIQVVDVMKLLQKADAKRFSQQWTLNYMLDTYHIRNPYNQAPLSKTGLKIHEMFNYWEEKSHLYRIALYCTQDAWICGTLIIERSNIVDKFAIAETTHTSFEDAIYHADGMRVSCTRASYGRERGFAVMDEPYEHRERLIKENWMKDDVDKSRGLGLKQFDDRGYIGGAVMNKHSRRSCLIVAADYSAQYPSQYRAGNIASGTNVDSYIIHNPEKFGFHWALVKDIVDTYGPRKVFYGKYDSK